MHAEITFVMLTTVNTQKLNIHREYKYISELKKKNIEKSVSYKVSTTNSSSHVISQSKVHTTKGLRTQ